MVFKLMQLCDIHTGGAGANTHVTCTDQYAAPTLISYDGSHYNIANSPATVLQSAYCALHCLALPPAPLPATSYAV